MITISNQHLSIKVVIIYSIEMLSYVVITP